MAATSLQPFRSTRVRACATTDGRKPNCNTPPPSKWWAPLFHLSSEPDYIADSFSEVNNKKHLLSTKAEEAVPAARSRVAPGSFTAEKARKLRMMTKDTAFHDVMYHSAIASRLAFHHSDPSDV